MALSERAVLVAELKLDDNLTPGLKKAERGVSHFDSVAGKAGRGLKNLGASMLKLGAAAGVAGVAMLGLAVKGGIAALAESEAAAAQTAAVLKSTGGAARVTAKGIDELTSSLQAKVAVDDDVIRAGANMMLTFTNVKNEAGKGNKIFDRSIATLADMSRAMGGDMSKAAIQLGKALNDPIKGTGALSKVGVTFTEQQKKRIKAFVEEGKVAKAQAIILAELNKEFGGSGAAYAKTYAGTMEALGFAVEDAQKALATGLIPVLRETATWLRTELAKPEVIQGIKDAGMGLAEGFRGALKFAQEIPWGAIVDAGRGIAGFAKTALDFFNKIPDWAKTILVGGFAVNALSGGMLTSIAGEILFKRGGSPANPLFVADVTGGMGGGGSKSIFDVLKSALKFIIPAAVIAGVSAATWEGVVMPGLQEQAGANNDAVAKLINSGSIADMERSLAGLEGIPDSLHKDQLDIVGAIQSVLYEFDAAGVKSHNEALIAALRAAIEQAKAAPTPGVDLQGAGISPLRPRGEHAGRISNATRAGIILRVTEKTGKAPTADRVTAILLKTQATKLQAIKDTIGSGDERTAQRLASMTEATRSVTAAVNGTTAAVNAWSGFTIPAPVVNTTVTVTGFTVRTLNRKQTVNRSINPAPIPGRNTSPVAS